jgi:hypothetical protein
MRKETSAALFKIIARHFPVGAIENYGKILSG